MRLKRWTASSWMKIANRVLVSANLGADLGTESRVDSRSTLCSAQSRIEETDSRTVIMLHQKSSLSKPRSRLAWEKLYQTQACCQIINFGRESCDNFGITFCSAHTARILRRDRLLRFKSWMLLEENKKLSQVFQKDTLSNLVNLKFKLKIVKRKLYKSLRRPSYPAAFQCFQ